MFDCTEVAPAAEPLVVDWPDHDRMDLGIKLRDEGVAVVHYGCDGIKLLKHCTIPGSYRFAGSSALVRVIELESADSVQASLPVQGLKFSAEVSGDSKIDIATAIIGRMGTMVTAPGKSDLTGECDGATHYVRSAYLGAFTMATGTKGKAAAAADVFKFSASGSSSSSRSALTQDGDVAACEAYDPNTPQPPGKCRSAVRLELSPLAAQPDPEKDGLANVCAAGFVPAAGGKCTRPGSGAAYRCDREDFADCKTQCELGNADSCYNAAIGPRSRRPLPPNHPEYPKRKREQVPFMEKACTGGVGLACNALGITYGSKNSGLLNLAKSAQYYRKACFDAFFGTSCIFLARMHIDGKGMPKNPRKGVALMSRACNLGSASGCNELGKWHLQGNPKAKVAKNPARGVQILKSACEEGKLGYACLDLADHMKKAKNPKASMYKAKGCKLEPKSHKC